MEEEEEEEENQRQTGNPNEEETRNVLRSSLEVCATGRQAGSRSVSGTLGREGGEERGGLLLPPFRRFCRGSLLLSLLH
jgi:hypothetical protein